MKNVMIAAWITEDDKYENYGNALALCGAEGFISLNIDDLDKADALILPGSPQDMNPKLWGEEDTNSNDINDELDSIQWALLEKAIADNKPVLGICRGMQFINVFFGGTLFQDLEASKEHEAAPDGEPERYHNIFTVRGTAMSKLYPVMTIVNTRHHQGLGRLGKNLTLSAFWSNDEDDIVMEAIEHKELPIWGVQWHPERMALTDNEETSELGKQLIEAWLEL